MMVRCHAHMLEDHFVCLGNTSVQVLRLVVEVHRGVQGGRVVVLASKTKCVLPSAARLRRCSF